MNKSSKAKPNTFKVVIVGDQSVGKTHILHQYVQGNVPLNVQATIGVDFQTKMITLNQTGEQVRLSFFDTAGEEKFHAVTACHYRKAKGAIIVYDVTNRQSFESVERWLKDVRQLTEPDCTILVLGNKKDIDFQQQSPNSINEKQQRQVSTAEGIEFAKLNEVSFFEVSAIQNLNINEAVQILANEILDKYKIELLNRSSRRTNQTLKIEKHRFECCISRGGENPQSSLCC